MNRIVRESQVIYRETHRLKSGVFCFSGAFTLFVAHSLRNDRDQSVAVLTALLGFALVARALWLLMSVKTVVIDRAQSFLLLFEGKPLRSGRRRKIPLEAAGVLLETRKHTAVGGKSGPIGRIKGKILLTLQGEEPVCMVGETYAVSGLRATAERIAADLGRPLRFSENSEP